MPALRPPGIYYARKLVLVPVACAAIVNARGGANKAAGRRGRAVAL